MDTSVARKHWFSIQVETCVTGPLPFLSIWHSLTCWLFFFLQHLAAKTTKQNYRPPGSIGGDINQFHKFLFVGLYCWSPGGSNNIYSFFSRAQAFLLWVIDLKVCVFFSQFLFGLFLRRNPPGFCRDSKNMNWCNKKQRSRTDICWKLCLDACLANLCCPTGAAGRKWAWKGFHFRMCHKLWSNRVRPGDGSYLLVEVF